jgi:hypothetical protein
MDQKRRLKKAAKKILTLSPELIKKNSGYSSSEEETRENLKSHHDVDMGDLINSPSGQNSPGLRSN